MSKTATATKSPREVMAERVAKIQASEAEDEAPVPYSSGGDGYINDESVPAQATNFAPLVQASRELARPDRSKLIEQSDLVIPRLSLGQAISRAVQNELVKGGEWYLNLDTQVLGKKVEIVPLSYAKHRALFITGQGLACRSYDMEVGVGTPGGDCDSCPLKDWVVDPGTGKTVGAPKCRVNYDFVVMARAAGTDDEPVMCILSLSGVSASEAKKFITSAVNRRAWRTPSGEQVVDWQRDVYLLSSERQDGAKGIYHKAVISRISDTPDDLLRIAEQHLVMVDDRAMSKSFEADEELAA